MSRLVVGVMGHVDHGKTALVRALTGQETDRLAEEQERGISIALGFAHLAVGDVTVDLVDMPGHEKFVRTMIAGATGIDAVLLIVAANEGVKPQTVEHVQIAGLLGVKRAVVVVTKADLVDADMAQLVADEAAALLRDAGLEPLPPALTSVPDGRGLGTLTHALAGLADSVPPRPEGGIAYLPVDRAFAISGHGPVVTGTLRGDVVAAGETLELLPARRQVRVRAVQVHGAKAEKGAPGQRVALNLRDVDMADLSRGMALATPGALEPSEWVTIAIRALPGAPDLANGARLRALFGTREEDVRLRLLDRDVLKAGESGFAQLRFASHAALPAGEHVILRQPSPAATVAGGRVLDPVTRRLRRHAPRTIDRLTRLCDLAPADLIATEIAEARGAGSDLAHLSRLTALRSERVVEMLRGLPVIGTRAGLIVSRPAFDRLSQRIPALLPLTREQIGTALPSAGSAVVDELLRRLLAAGTIAKHGQVYVVADASADRARAGREAEVTAALAETLRAAGLSPPTPKELPSDPASKRALDHLLRAGTIVRAVDRDKKKELLFHRDAIAQARATLAPLLTGAENQGGLLVAEITAALGISRKFAMPLLDHLDTTRFTRRVGDRRILHMTPER